jgi:succinate-semialdehyde dehydrogenase/glutarate-semialdehyde dehydrogenase
MATYDSALEIFINGEWRSLAGRDKIDVRDPATGDVIGVLPTASTEDLDDALAAANEGFQVWRKISAWDRQVIMQRAAALIQERRDTIAGYLALETGKPLSDAKGEMDRVVETILWNAEEGKRVYGRVLPPRTNGMLQMTVKRPVGPVAAFAAWNFPAVLVARKVAAALAAGCSIIIKPAEETPASCIAIARAFDDAGLPKGVLNMVFGVPAHISDYLIASPVIKKISFTGSVEVGRLLSTLAAKQLKSVTMELGGHSPVIICDDANIPKVAAACAGFKYRNAGQVCITASRFYVHEKVYDQFVDCFTQEVKKISVGHGLEQGTTMGPLANDRRLAAAELLVADAVERGAKVVMGGQRMADKGYFFAPTILTHLDPASKILNEEPFCPIAPILSFSDLEDVMQQANDVDYGLAAYAFTDSIAKVAYITEAYEAGWIGINNFTPALADAPISGVKSSGLGYEGGPEGLDAYTQIRFISQTTPA